MKKKILILLFAVFLIFGAFSISAYASGGSVECPICGNIHTLRFASDLGEMAYNNACLIYGGKTDGIGQIMESFAKFDTTANTGAVDFTTIWSAASKGYSLISTFGIIVVLIAFAMAVIDNLREDTLNPEKMVMLFIKFALSYLIIQNGFEILTWFLGLSGEIFDRISFSRSAVTTAISQNQCNFAKMCDAAWYNAIGEWLITLPGYLIVKVTDIVATVICLTRIGELILMTMFAPLGMGDIGFKDYHSNGWRYFKKYFAVALQGAVIIALYFVYTLLTTGMGSGWVIRCIYRVVLILAILKSQSMANEIVGV